MWICQQIDFALVSFQSNSFCTEMTPHEQKSQSQLHEINVQNKISFDYLMFLMTSGFGNLIQFMTKSRNLSKEESEMENGFWLATYSCTRPRMFNSAFLFLCKKKKKKKPFSKFNLKLIFYYQVSNAFLHDQPL